MQRAIASLLLTTDCKGLIPIETQAFPTSSPREESMPGDSLTGLGDHRSFQRCLSSSVQAAGERSEGLSLALVDVDRLKFLNDCFGYPEGDEVLSHLAGVLAHASASCHAFRIGGDEFALVMPGLDASEATALLEGCVVEAAKRDVSAKITIGFATLCAEDEGDFALLTERAASALEEAKRSGRGTVVSFDDVADIVTVVSAAKVSSLCALLDEPRLEIAFQPIWDLEFNCLLGMEALARPWAGYGFEGPAEMFDIAEKIGRAHELDAVCVSATLSRAADIPKGALLFLNINPQALVHDVVTAKSLAAQAHANGLRPEQIVLEITERSDARLGPVVERAEALAELGFKLALDDVGVGNAGIEMLCELPINFLKIDRSIISKVLSSQQARAAFIALALFAYRTDAFVITEGIETDEVMNFVKNAHHLDMMRDPPIKGAQGYLLGRPSADTRNLPLSAVEAVRRSAPQPVPAPVPFEGTRPFADVA
jgi:diguanylate cyclase (GGDEF)-like protein